MTATLADLQGRFISACGGYVDAVSLATNVSRGLWDFVHSPTYCRRLTKSVLAHSGGDMRPLLPKEMTRIVRRFGGTPNAACLLLDILEACEIYQTRDPHHCFAASVFDPRNLARNLVGSTRSEADLRYGVMRAIRAHYQLPLSERTVFLFNQLASNLNCVLDAACTARPPATPQSQSQRDSVDLTLDAIGRWRKCLRPDITTLTDIHVDTKALARLDEICSCFLETCRAIGSLSLSDRADHIRISSDYIDAESLLSNLFGMPTDIAGFDQLFGGGGIILPEASGSAPCDPLGLDRNPLPARLIIVAGARGTGKSILSSCLAAEVAKRGGVAWLLPLEQTPQEALYTLETTNSICHGQVDVASTLGTATAALEAWTPNRGSLLLLRLDDGASLDDGGSSDDLSRLHNFVSALSATIRGLRTGNVRLLVVDPLNSRFPAACDPAQSNRSRRLLLQMIEEIKRSGTNVLLVTEEADMLGGDASGGHDLASGAELTFAENVADAIIRLSVRKRHNYAPRRIEIRKSRIQREQRGEHAFSIRPGEGIHVFPSPASVNARTRQRRPPVPSEIVRFGLPSIDDVLGEDSLYSGDVIVFEGTGDSFKTQLGLWFLLCTPSGASPGSVSLLFTAKDSPSSVQYVIDRVQARRREDGAPTRPDVELRVVGLPRGHVSPGVILQLIENEVEILRVQQKSLHRIMIDNVDIWQTSSPFIGEDRTFAVTLVDLLRALRATCLVACGSNQPDNGNMQTVISEMADCTFHFDRFEFRGTQRVAIRILKSRGMRHRLESFELHCENDTISVTPSSSLLRIQESGRSVAPVPIRMLFHMETRLQQDYYRSVRDAIKVVLSNETRLDYQDRIVLSRALDSSHLSAVDELQLLQLDEFQLPRRLGAHGGNISLRHFDFSRGLSCDASGARVVDGLVGEEHFDKFRRNCLTGSAGRQGFSAVPFYANISLLAYDVRHIRRNDPVLASWEKLAALCWSWEKANPLSATSCSQSDRDGSLFFEFARNGDETYNCFFFEILLSLRRPSPTAGGRCPIRDWVSSQAARRAGAILRMLCRRSAQNNPVLQQGFSHGSVAEAKEASDDDPARGKLHFSSWVRKDAVLYRHWYTTLNEMFAELSSSPSGRKSVSNVGVASLPGGIASSGEWYLGIPSHSAAPDAGLEIMKVLTSREAELSRVRLGVGLPTRRGFYRDEGRSRARLLDVSPYFQMDRSTIASLIEGAFSRSCFGCYVQFSPLLSYHLKKLVERQDAVDGTKSTQASSAMRRYERLAKESLDMFISELDFLQDRKLPDSEGSNYRGDACERCRHEVKNAFRV